MAIVEELKGSNACGFGGYRRRNFRVSAAESSDNGRSPFMGGEFDNFMGNVFTPSASGAMIWWKNIQSPHPYFLNEEGITNRDVPYFTEAQKTTIVDVVNTTNGYRVYSFTLGMGYPY